MTKSVNLQLAKLDIDSYLASLASSAATPGGGAVAGLTGAQAAALLCMVCNLSQGHSAECNERISEINQFCETAREELLYLANEDAKVFTRVMNAYGLSKSNSSEKSDRQKAIQVALEDAAEVPHRVMEKTSLLLQFAEELAEIGNPNLISDVGVAVHLIEATLHSAKLNVVVNTRLIKNESVARDFDASIENILEILAQYKTVILDKVQYSLNH